MLYTTTLLLISIVAMLNLLATSLIVALNSK